VLEAAALCLVLCLGWLVLREPEPEREQPLAPGGPAAVRPVEESLVARVLERDLCLAEAAGPAEQLQALADMAADLHGESVHRARRHDPELLARLYERVVREGVVGRALALPAGQHGMLVPLAEHLRQTAREAERLGPEQPALCRMGTAAREVERVLLGASRGSPAPRDRRQPERGPEPHVLLEVLVVQGLRLAEEDDPLRRADRCTDVTDSLMRALLHAEDGDDAAEMARLGTCVGLFVDRAVGENLGRVEPEEADPVRRAERERVRRRAADAADAAERGLERVPGAVRPALEQVVRALRKAEKVKVKVKVPKEKPRGKGYDPEQPGKKTTGGD
jgi:hypothetical protein